MTENPAHREKTVCYNCSNPVLKDDLKRHDFECPHCGKILSAEHVHKGPENLGQVRLNPSTEMIDIERIRSALEEADFILDTNGPEPPDGAQQLGITIYRNYFPPEE